LDGFLCVDKPRGISSFAVVSRVRKKMHCKKVGHAGTLDPEATGLLVLALGFAVKLLPYISVSPKEYEFTIQFGHETDTLDSVGKVVSVSEKTPSVKSINHVIPEFLGEIQQRPPQYSAVKVRGKRAYSRARRGEDFIIPERTITIDRLDLLLYQPEYKKGDFITQCSSGTYVRSLARDIAKRVGSCGHCSRIHRTVAGNFSLGNAYSLEEFESSDNPKLISITDALSEMVSEVLSEKQIESVRFGRDCYLTQRCFEQDLVLGIHPGGECVALLKKVEGLRFHPFRVAPIENW